MNLFKRAVIAVMLLLMTTACGAVSTEEVKDNPTVIQTESAHTTEELNKPVIEEDSREEDKLKEEVSQPDQPIAVESKEADEEIAMAYITDFLNSEDIKGKEEYLHKHVLESRQSWFMKAVSNITAEEYRFNNPKLIESQQFEYQGKRISLVLIQSSTKAKNSTKEVIILLENSKLVTGYLASEIPHYDISFQILREGFKDAQTQVGSTSKQTNLSGDEYIAVSFFTKFLNPKDSDEQINYYSDHIDEAMKNIYNYYLQAIMNDFGDYTDVEIVESVAYPLSDKSKGSLILLQTASGEELIMVMKKSKIVIPYKESDRMHDSIIFHKLREKFSTPQSTD